MAAINKPSVFVTKAMVDGQQDTFVPSLILSLLFTCLGNIDPVQCLDKGSLKTLDSSPVYHKVF